ncbi:IPT/TIG domain-containing protein [Gelria sp. Kuro-4]|uniref:IPT/TIG domain-containing protein n=1 Tax=Gelria sp. Kuro-4 TaxID=2796927 RepID=UPI001BEE0CB1|nr:IPT/TIG domain-containing protein [Gelria sp. Kuro-4]BCV23432.1 hypothetical protein kuro4_02050 [Gelria sp. Kuro-4]
MRAHKLTALALAFFLLFPLFSPPPVRAAGPEITGITAQDGYLSAAGGTIVTISGSGFAQEVTVTFGGRPAEKIIQVSTDGKSIEAVAPYGDVGATTLKVTNPDGQAATYTVYYRKSAPSIKSVSPAYGHVKGGTVITITGSEFDNRRDAQGNYLVTVQVGNANARVTDVAHGADGTHVITAVTSAGSAGLQPVKVINPDGGSYQFYSTDVSKPEGFEYVEAPYVTSITPNYGPTSGGTEVEIRGQGFFLLLPSNPDLDQGQTYVSLGGKKLTRADTGPLNAGYYQVLDDNLIKAKTPGGVGAADLVISYTNTKAQTVESRLPGGFVYTSEPVTPTIASISPNAGSTAGGYVVTITGTNFISGARVFFGAQEAKNVAVKNGQEIEVIAPPAPGGLDGWQDVKVANPEPNGYAVRQQGFLYQKPEKALVITGVSPAQGPMGERTTVVLQGINFPTADDGTVKVYFGGKELEGTGVIQSDASTMTVTTPIFASDEDQVSVTVSLLVYRPIDGNWVTEVAELPSGFTFYKPVPVPEFADQLNGAAVLPIHNVETLSPEGPVAGGSTVVIYARRLTKDVKVYFGPEPTDQYLAARQDMRVADAVYSSDPVFELTVTAPPAPGNVPGSVPVWLVNPAPAGQRPGIAQKEGGFIYRGNNLYLSSVRPAEGPTAGGTKVEIIGENFNWINKPESELTEAEKQLRLEKTHIYFGSEEATEGKDIIPVENGLDIIRVILPANTEGVKDVTVRNPFGERKLLRAFTYYTIKSRPTIRAVEPAFGDGRGGTSLTITGLGFEEGATVLVGGRPATNVKLTVTGEVYENQTVVQLTCLTPSGDPGPARITVTNKDGGSTFVDGKFTYISVPKITSVTPAAGTIDGGTWVTIKGTGFLQEERENGGQPELVGPTVYFGSRAAGRVVFISPTEVAAKTPPAAKGAGPVDVTLVNPDAGRDGSPDSGRVTLPGGFTYRVPATAPTVLAIDPERGTTAGGTVVTITGSDFRQGAAVYFGYKPASKVTWRDYGKLEATTPPGEKGSVDVTVINPDYGQAQKEGGFTYVAPGSLPEIHSVFPLEGSLAGGTLVTVKGVDFRVRLSEGGEVEYPKVLFGNQPAEVQSLTDSRGKPVEDADEYGTTLKVLTPPADQEGPVDVTVINPDAAQVTLAGAFTYRRTSTRPQIGGLSPSRGQAGGGTPVLLTGSDFAQGAKVYFDGNPAQKVTWLSSTALVAITPAGPADRTVDVTVLNPDGASYTMEQGFTYIPDPLLQPSITAVIPNQGPVTGGTKVDIWGTNFQEGLTVLFGGQTVPVEVYGPGPAGSAYVRVTAPAVEKAGPVDISVINPDGGTATAPGAFTYTAETAAITLDGIAPTKGPRSGNIPAQLTGSGFLQGAKVFLGGTEAQGAQVVDGSTITFTVPPAPPGQGDLTVDVVVVNPDGASDRLAGGFTYTTPTSRPKLTAVAPNTGRSQGGTPVTIQGGGFEQTPAVFFGGRLADNTAWVSDTELTGRTPPGAAGAVTVTVVNPDGAVASLRQAFTYEDKPGPKITALNPTSGPSAGGTEVTITGSNFDLGIRVDFGDVPATNVTRVSDTELTAITPEHDLGAVDVTVTNPDGSTFTLPDAFSFTGPPKPPTGLTARALSANTIELSWTAPAGALTYEIYMGQDRDDLTFFGTSEGKAYGAPADQPEIRYFYAEGLEPDTRYYFAVRAVNAEGVSGETMTASARTKDEDYSEPGAKPELPEYQVTPAGGAGGTAVSIAPGTLGGSRYTIDLDKPEYARERRFSLVLPAADLSGRTTVNLTTPRLALSFPVRALYTSPVRDLSRSEEKQAAVTLTIEEAQGAEAAALLRELPAGLVPASPLYRLSTGLSVGHRQVELPYLAESVSLKAKLDPAYYAGAPTLYRYDPDRDAWVNAGAYLSAWSGETVLDRPGFYVILARHR